MTKGEALFLKNQILEPLERLYFDKETKAELTRDMFYAIRKNIRILNPVAKELEAIQKDIDDSFKKDVEFDEAKYGSDEQYKQELDKKYTEHNKSESVRDILKSFNEEECSVELYKKKEEEIEECILDSHVVELLIKYLT